ncbi:MAG: ribosome small subunit-dependent GTPase A, partial [Myxococcales bacterium]|nr:ribosome small subunit-dependent GTPase A [Myxococcales bacterium]
KGRGSKAPESRVEGLPGRVVATAGRRVWVRDDEGERTCFLSGQRAVVGDRVRWIEARGEGGKLVAVEPRRTELVRGEGHGQEQVLAANLQGLLVVTTPTQPPFRGGLLDRYLVAAGICGLDVVIVLNKIDLGVPEEVERALALREETGIRVVRVCAKSGEGLEEIRALLAESGEPWAMVGHSGVGKTSIARSLLPGVDVGEVGQVSEYWGTGRHTTTGSKLFDVPGGGELLDSPGIRTFAPGRLGPEEVRLYFPGTHGLPCKYRDCLHRPGEDGCVLESELDPELVASYRRLYDEIATTTGDR